MLRQWGKALRRNQDMCMRLRRFCRESVALCCVAIEKAMRARQTKSGAHDKASTLRLGVHDKGILS